MKLTSWTASDIKREIPRRFKMAQDGRRGWESKWSQNESTIYNLSGDRGAGDPAMSTSMETSFLTGTPGVDAGGMDMNVSYAFKNLRFIHAQMSANPPSVVMRPNSSDPEDRRAADAADRVVRYAIRHYSMQERVDQLTLHTLLYGTGILKIIWDASKGDIVEVDETSGSVILEGDISISNPSIWNIFLDPDARSSDDVKWVIERIHVDYDEAISRWPDKEGLLKKAKAESSKGASPFSSSMSDSPESAMRTTQYNTVELLEYWETGLPTNGYLGRHCITTVEGDEIQAVRPNPHRFARDGKLRQVESAEMPDDQKEMRRRKLPQIAQLPYHILTDVDVPARVLGRSFLDYAGNLQEILNRLDTAIVDNVQAHGVARLVLPEGAEIAEDGLSNSPWDVTKITGSQPPHFMEVPALMPDMHALRNNLIAGINDTSGVNEAMFGQQSREQSGASMQYATNQGNMIRRRLFNKYVLVTESIYKSILRLVVKHWDTQKTIRVIGKEKALEAVDLRGIDIDGGYDVVGEYGVSLSLDPMTRREEIVTLQPLFEKAGVPPRVSLKMMKLNELEGMYDILQLAEDRQREYYEEIIASGKYVPPAKFEDHQNMMAWSLQYFMTVEFKYLELQLKDMIHAHFEERGRLAAQEASGGASGDVTSQMPPGPAPGGPAPGELPVGAGMTGAPATEAEAPEMLPA